MAPRVAHHGNLSREYREHAEQTGFHRLLYHLGTRDPRPRRRTVTDDAGDQSLHLLMELARELRAGDGGLRRAKAAGPCALQIARLMRRKYATAAGLSPISSRLAAPAACRSGSTPKGSCSGVIRALFSMRHVP